MHRKEEKNWKLLLIFNCHVNMSWWYLQSECVWAHPQTKQKQTNETFEMVLCMWFGFGLYFRSSQTNCESDDDEAIGAFHLRSIAFTFVFALSFHFFQRDLYRILWQHCKVKSWIYCVVCVRVCFSPCHSDAVDARLLLLTNFHVRYAKKKMFYTWRNQQQIRECG